VDTLEFGEFVVEEKLHIVISVKDFKSIIAHAGITNTMVKALYSRPTSPMQLTYSEDGILSEFILMTIGESRAASATPAPTRSGANSKRPASRQPLEATSSSKRTAISMAPPPTTAGPSQVRDPAKARASRPSPPPPQPSLQSDALFVTEAEDDRRWDPTNFDEEEDEMLLWDTPGDKVSMASCTFPGTDADKDTGTGDNEFGPFPGIRNRKPKCQRLLWVASGRRRPVLHNSNPALSPDPKGVRGLLKFLFSGRCHSNLI